MQTQHADLEAESHLTMLAAEGDLQAFNDLVLRHQDVVYGLALSMLQEHDDAQDAAQEAFTRAFKHIRGFRGGSFKGWLLRITANTCYDIFRRRRRQPTTPLFQQDPDGEELESTTWLADPRPSPEAQTEHSELSRMLYWQVDRLPAPYRIVITLVDLQGLDYAEAAEALDVPVGTIKSRLARARLQLREALTQVLPSARDLTMVNALAPA